jgi:hypothetical protein
MPNKHPIVDPDAAVAALNDLVDTINATGGVSPEYDDLPLEENTPTPVADEDWIDLAAAYALACRALGLPMQWAGVVECTQSTEPAEWIAEENEQTLAMVPEEERLIVIDLGGGVVHGVETNILELQGVKVLVLGDQKDSDGDRDEVVIEGTDWIVYQTERVAISDCTWLLKSLTQYESQKVEDPP